MYFAVPIGHLLICSNLIGTGGHQLTIHSGCINAHVIGLSQGLIKEIYAAKSQTITALRLSGCYANGAKGLN